MQPREEIHKNWHQAAHEALYWNKMANDRLAEINKQLLGLATLLLPLTGSVVVLQVEINDVLKTLLIGGWIFLFLSILTGFIQIFIDAKFFKGYCDYNTERSETYHMNLGSTVAVAEAAVDRIEKPEISSGHLFLILQGIAISLGLLLITVVATSLLIAKHSQIH